MPEIRPEAIEKLSATTGIPAAEVSKLLSKLDGTPEQGEAFAQAVNFFASEEVNRLPPAMRQQLDTIAGDMLMMLKTKMVELPEAQKRQSRTKIGGFITMAIGAAVLATAAAFLAGPLGAAAALVPVIATGAGVVGAAVGGVMAHKANKTARHNVEQVTAHMMQLQDDYVAQQNEYSKSAEKYLTGLKSQMDAVQHVNEHCFADRVGKREPVAVAPKDPHETHVEAVQAERAASAVKGEEVGAGGRGA